MEFCKDCGSILFYFKEKGENKVYCKKCRSATLSEGKGNFSETQKKKELGQGFIEGGNPSATYDHQCKKCGHIGVEIIDVGILYSDEDNLILLKCGKCGFSERLGHKVT